jgi:hypothetical protein
MRISIIIKMALSVACLAGCASAGELHSPARSEDYITINNNVLTVSYNLKDATFSARRGETMFIKNGRFPEAAPGEMGSARMKNIKDALESGKAIEVTFPSGDVYSLTLYTNVPFVCVTSRIHNSTDKKLTIHKRVPICLEVNLGTAPENLRILGCDGLTTAEEDRISYTFLAMAEPATRNGVVAGWLTHNRASGVVLSKPDRSSVHIEGRSEYGNLLIAPGKDAEGEIFAVGCFKDALIGLEEYAETAARVYNIKLPKIPCGYCTWYSNPHGGASDEKHMAELAEFCRKELTKFGFEVLQIDDRWQLSGRDFTSYNPNGPYPNGMKPTAETIKVAGMTPGIWLIPTGWDPNRPVFKEHQDWFVHKTDGSIYTVHWGGSCLDMTHPEARKFLHEVISRITRGWGYKYIKIDGLWTGMAVKILYPKPDYRDDNLGDAVFHNPAKTNVEAYRDGLKLVRQAAGRDVYILGCNIAQNMRTLGASFGLVDGMRVGSDIGARWSGILSGATMGTRLYFMHNRLWHNDPDCLMLRNPLTLDQARAWGSWIAISGQLNIASEWLPGLPAGRLDIVKRSMPNHGLCGRPIDLFESPLAQVWHLTAGSGQQRKDVIGLFNWDDKKPDTIRVELNKLSLPSSGTYIGFDYWANEFIQPFSNTLEMELRPSSCRVISIRPLLDKPVLVSTSRHVTQGIVDVAEQSWDERDKQMHGKSNIVEDDPYELRFFTPKTASSRQVDSVNVSTADRKAGVKIKADQKGLEIRVTIDSPMNRLVSWTIGFKKS